MSAAPVRLRFAPSPTGPLHLGGARTALFNWAAARALGGNFLLRIEDTDRQRSTDESLRIILEGLRWIGIDWDEGPEVGGAFGPYFQTQRLDLYQQYVDRLLAGGHAYRCYATPEEVEEGRQRLAAAGQRPMYDRRHRDLTPDQCAAFEAGGRRPSIRFRMPLDGDTTIADLVRGQVTVQHAELDDWVMLRADGMPTYNLACVVDDIEMHISHVIRGEEHLLNGIKQALLFERFARPAPAFAHVPLILGKDGKKLSKRDANTNILDYRDLGYPPEAVFNYIATLGWAFSGDRDLFTTDEMVQRFRIADISKGGARFDEDKLRAMCGVYVRQKPIAELVAAVTPFLRRAAAVPEAAFTDHPGLLRNVIACYQERIERYADLADKVGWVFADPAPDAAAAKNLAKYPDAASWLRAYAELLEQVALPPSYPEDRGDADDRVSLPTRPEDDDLGDDGLVTPRRLERDARALAERLGVKFGHLVHPLRAALTGTDRGPGLFDCVFLIGKQACLRRLRAAAS